jgi:predicted secreted acid phosphatase
MPYYIKKKKSDKPKKRQTSQATLVKKLDKAFSQYVIIYSNVKFCPRGCLFSYIFG